MVRSRSYVNGLSYCLNKFRFNNSRLLVKYTPFYLKKVSNLSLVSLKKKWKRYSNFYLYNYNYIFNGLAKITKFSFKFFKMELKKNVNFFHIAFSGPLNYSDFGRVFSKLNFGLTNFRTLSLFVNFFNYSKSDISSIRNFNLISTEPGHNFLNIDGGLVVVRGSLVNAGDLKRHLVLSYKLLLNSIWCQVMSFNLSTYSSLQLLTLTNALK